MPEKVLPARNVYIGQSAEHLIVKTDILQLHATVSGSIEQSGINDWRCQLHITLKIEQDSRARCCATLTIE